MGNTLMELKDIVYHYPDGARAIDNLSISIPGGKKIAFLGPNGAGKTTLFFLMNGSFKPQKGSICFKGEIIRHRHDDLKRLRQKVGVVFQDPNVQVFSMTVEQEISFGPKNLGLPDRDVAARVEMAMDLTGIRSLRERATHYLSFGEKKLVSLSSILAMEPEVLVMDEPLSGLDPRQRENITAIMETLGRNRTIVISTHNIDMAYGWADHVIILKKGRVLTEGCPEEVFINRRVLYEAHLDIPRILQLYQRLAALGKINEAAKMPKTEDELVSMVKKSVRDYREELQNINFCLNYL